MLLYFSMFTLGFWAGAVLSFRLFAVKRPEEEEKPATFVLINPQKNNKKQIDQSLPNSPVSTLTPVGIKES